MAGRLVIGPGQTVWTCPHCDAERKRRVVLGTGYLAPGSRINLKCPKCHKPVPDIVAPMPAAGAVPPADAPVRESRPAA